MTVVFLTRSQIKIYNVDSSSLSPLQPVYELNYTLDNFIDTITGLKLTGNLRFLLSNELSYLANIEVPGDQKDIRQYITTQIPSLFPDVLEPFDWDYCQTDLDSGVKKVLIFAPIKPYKQLINQLSQSGLSIISFEPEAVAATRHQDAIVGAALKKDISGSDDQVLNLAPPPHHRLNPSWFFIPLFIVVFVSVNVYIFKLIQYKRSVVAPVLPTITPTISFPTPTPTPTTIPVRIQVVNGTGVTGLAGRLGDDLRSIGYSSITVGNTSPSFTKTIAKFKTQDLLDSVSSKVKPVLKLSNSQLVVDKDIEFDAIFIIGKN